MRRAPWAALLTSLLCGAAAARQPAEPATLGRLFSTPQERSVLDARRSGGPDQPAGPDMGAGAIPGLPGQGAIG
uniref:hypothetical protein n=1 Tax=Rugamonas sp. TaxID=1926287 RepID=UPI0025E79D86